MQWSGSWRTIRSLDDPYDTQMTLFTVAVNHSGDSDSTGAIAGNLVGLMLGLEAIPAAWLTGLELREEIDAVASDLWSGFEESDAWRTRYPGW